jgi:hypothetical protein
MAWGIRTYGQISKFLLEDGDAEKKLPASIGGGGDGRPFPDGPLSSLAAATKDGGGAWVGVGWGEDEDSGGVTRDARQDGETNYNLNLQINIWSY